MFIELGIILYVIVNIYIIIRYYNKEGGFIEFPYIMALVGIGVTLPQLTSIYFLPQLYAREWLPDLLYTMITANIAMAYGYEKAFNKNTYEARILSININRFSTILVLMAFMGIYGISSYMGKQFTQSDDNVIQMFMMTFASVALTMGISAYLEGRNTFKYKLIIIIAAVTPIVFAFFIKGSRTSTLTLILLLFYTWYYKKWKYYNKLKNILIIIFFAGSILSASIGILRNVMKGNVSRNVVSTELIIQSFKDSFTSDDTDFGMDLGNAAVAINFTKENAKYDYGIYQVWNDFVQDYIPRRLVGEAQKDSYFYKTGAEKIIANLTNNTTVMTCYYSCFAAFGYFGFILAFIIGFILGTIKRKAVISNFYVFLNLFLIGHYAIFVTHGYYFLYNKLLFIIIFVCPIMFISGSLFRYRH